MNSKSKPSFRIPDEYFESVQDTWKIKNLALKKQGGFGVPKDYFSKKYKVSEQEQPTPSPRFNYWIYSTAASLILCFIFFLENKATSFLADEENIEDNILVAEEVWENDTLFSFEKDTFNNDYELALENSMDYFMEDERFVNLMYEDYE